MLVADGDVVPCCNSDGLGNTSGHDEAAGRQLTPLGAQHVGQHRYALGRVAQYGGASASRDDFAVLLQDDTQAFQVDALYTAHLAACDESRRGRVISDDALEIEAEVLVARVDDLDCRQNEISGSQYVANVHARAFQRMLEHKGDLGFHFGVDQTIDINGGAIKA